MGLTEYRKKRDFAVTPEPEGEEKTQEGFTFVVQKHAASRLHYDFRLELDGVLKSWAVPKGPSLDPSVRALAVQVEDHPIEYGSFEGVIPKDEYGGGTVMLWDRGTWQPIGNPHKSLENGSLKFRLFGEKLRGRWKLIRVHGREADEKKNWLLLKAKDNAAKSLATYDIKQAMPASVATGRSMEQIASAADRVWSSSTGEDTTKNAPRYEVQNTFDDSLMDAPKSDLPTSFRPQLATLASSPPDSSDWLYELKFDGYRLLAEITADGVRLLTRTGKDWTNRFPSIVSAVRSIPENKAILDGEVVVQAADGTSDFQALQNAISGDAPTELIYYIFDLPFFAGRDLTRWPLLKRKELLSKLIRPLGGQIIRYSDHIIGNGEAVEANACRLGLEGIIAKHIASPYEQRRTDSWLKIKCRNRQEFVIGGWTNPAGARQKIGALLLGVYIDAELTHCGRVGTGFTSDTLHDLYQQLLPLRRDNPPFVKPPTGVMARDVNWTEPTLVTEVEFRHWTDDGIIRHASFKGLRLDKSARTVVREQSIAPDRTSRMKPSRPPATKRINIKVTHPERVVYPEEKLTKADVVKYYSAVADWILPYLKDRPISIVRCPNGITKQCFFQKHVNEGIPEAIEAISVAESDGVEQYISIKDTESLLALVQLNALEFHPWGARADRLDRPDMMIIDIDPDETVHWDRVISAAFTLRDLLSELTLASLLRTTGGKGLHIVVPVARRSTWDTIKTFSQLVAKAMVRADPKSYIATSAKAKRKDKIYIDYLRNSEGATAIASYSTRARVGATVATPIHWHELTTDLVPSQLNIRTVPDRLNALQTDPWVDLAQTRQSVTNAMIRALE